MKSIERQDWLQSVSESLPSWRLTALKKLLARLDGASSRGFWEGGVCGRSGAKSLGLRYFGEPAEFSKWRTEAGELLGIPRDGNNETPTDGFPWLSLVWNAATGRLERAALLSRASSPRGAAASSHLSLNRAAGAAKLRKVLFQPDRYSPRTLGDADLARVLDAFGAHCPIRDLVYRFSVEASGKRRPIPEWSLRLKDPVSWPAFQRLDLAGSFSPESSLLSFLLLDRRVSELAFEGETLWAYFRA